MARIMYSTLLFVLISEVNYILYSIILYFYVYVKCIYRRNTFMVCSF